MADETEIAHQRDPFLQGDIIRLVDSQGVAQDPPYGVIINADCDLAHCKIDGVVSYLPLFPFEIYFKKFWAPTYIEDRARELASSISQQCELAPNEEKSLERWLLEEDPAAVTTRLAATCGLKEATLSSKISELALIRRSEIYDIQLLNKLIGYQKGSREDALNKLAKKALKHLGDSSFFINEIAGLSGLGFVARLRRIHSIATEYVFSSNAEFYAAAAGSATYAVRFARLTNLYRFKIAQLFAYQFTRIGLPDEITTLNELAVQAAVLQMRSDDV